MPANVLDNKPKYVASRHNTEVNPLTEVTGNLELPVKVNAVAVIAPVIVKPLEVYSNYASVDGPNRKYASPVDGLELINKLVVFKSKEPPEAIDNGPPTDKVKPLAMLIEVPLNVITGVPLAV